MAFNVQKKKGAISEINVVPLVDIMLVLLIIFMIAAPMMFNGIQLKLPQTKKVNQVRMTRDQIIVSLSRSGEYYIGSEKYLLKELIPEVAALVGNQNNKPVYLRADYGIKYGKVAHLISFLKRGGISNIALVTEVEKRN